MSVVCLDTQIIQWGVMKRASDAGSQQFIAHAGDFIRWLGKQQADVIVPSIVVAELLVPVPRDEHANVLAQFHENWLVVDFDIRAAQLFAQMRYDRAILQIMEEIRQGNPHATRRQLHADVMIIATAIAHGAEKLYSHNSDFLKLAQGYIPAENFLNVPVQRPLPDDGDPA